MTEQPKPLYEDLREFKSKARMSNEEIYTAALYYEPSEADLQKMPSLSSTKPSQSAIKKYFQGKSTLSRSQIWLVAKVMGLLIAEMAWIETRLFSAEIAGQSEQNLDGLTGHWIQTLTKSDLDPTRIDEVECRVSSLDGVPHLTGLMRRVEPTEQSSWCWRFALLRRFNTLQGHYWATTGAGSNGVILMYSHPNGEVWSGEYFRFLSPRYPEEIQGTEICWRRPATSNRE